MESIDDVPVEPDSGLPSSDTDPDDGQPADVSEDTTPAEPDSGPEEE